MTVSLRAMHRNARVSILTEPLWALFGTAALYYLTLLMKVNGLTDLQIGIIVSANLYLALFFQLLAGPVTNRLGRKRATFLFDITSWVVPMMIWALSNNFWFFLIGYLLNSTSKVVNVSFWLLATEDSPEEHRPRIFAAIKVLILLAGFVVPVVGFAISVYGTMDTLRVLFVLGSVAMLAHNLIRNALSVETSAGQSAMHVHKDIRLLRGVLDSLALLWRALLHPDLRKVVLLYSLSFLAFQINIFQVIYLSKNLELPDIFVGFVPAVAALASVVVFGIVMPWAERRLSISRLTFLAAILAAVGWALFLFATAQTSWLVLVSVLFSAAGTFALESYREALVINSVHEADRAGFYASVQTVTAIIAIPSGVVAAMLFTGHPLILFGTVVGLYALAAVFAWSGRGSTSTNPDDHTKVPLMASRQDGK